MTKKFTINLLSEKFYKKYKIEELLTKTNRPYLVLLIKVDNVQYAIPFRSHIKHKYAYKLNGYKNKRDYAGLDYTKSVIVYDQSYIGQRASIKKDQFIRLNSEFNLIYKEFIKFLSMYHKLLKKKNLNKTERNIFKMSTLRYFYD